eukprot:331721-Prymnesium_polylepis.1
MCIRDRLHPVCGIGGRAKHLDQQAQQRAVPTVARKGRRRCRRRHRSRRRRDAIARAPLATDALFRQALFRLHAGRADALRTAAGCAAALCAAFGARWRRAQPELYPEPKVRRARADVVARPQ